MARKVTKEEFVSGERSTSYGGRKNKIHTNHQTPVSRYYMKNAREVLWKKLRNIPLKTSEFFPFLIFNNNDRCNRNIIAQQKKLWTNHNTKNSWKFFNTKGPVIKKLLGLAGGGNYIPPKFWWPILNSSIKFHDPSQNIENVSWPILWYVCQGILINKFVRSHKDDFQFKNE